MYKQAIDNDASFYKYNINLFHRKRAVDNCMVENECMPLYACVPQTAEFNGKENFKWFSKKDKPLPRQPLPQEEDDDDETERRDGKKSNKKVCYQSTTTTNQTISFRSVAPPAPPPPLPSSQKKKTKKEIKEEEKLTKDSLSELTTVQKLNYGRLCNIYELDLSPEIEREVADLYEECTNMKTNKIDVRHCPSSDFPTGRLYARGLQSLSRPIRHLLGGQYYHDLDMKNSGPRILSQVFERYKCRSDHLTAFARDREGMCARVINSHHLLSTVTVEIMKQVIRNMIFGASYKKQLQTLAGITITRCEMLDDIYKSIKVSSKMLSQHPEFAQLFKEQYTEEDRFGPFIGRVNEIIESKIILEAANYLQDEGWVIGTLTFDGLMPYRKDIIDDNATSGDPFPKGIIRQLELHIMQEFGYNVEFVEKSLFPSRDDWDIYHGEKCLARIKSDECKQKAVITHAARLLKAVRKGGLLMQMHDTIPGVLVVVTTSLEFINTVLVSHLNLMRMADMKKLEQWFNMNNDACCSLVTEEMLTRRVIAFTNGFLDLDTLHLLQQSNYSREIITDHFFDVAFAYDMFERPTPNIDELLNYQLGERSRCVICGCVAHFIEDGQKRCSNHSMYKIKGEYTQNDILRILIGRLFFPARDEKCADYPEGKKRDNWQVWAYIWGIPNTGKSTLADIIKACFPIDSVGTIGRETTFGLQSLRTKRAIIVPELPAKLDEVLPQVVLQSIITGEAVSIAVKYTEAINSEPWTIPGMFFLNPPDFPYADKDGAMNRRLARFHFPNEIIGARNTEMGSTIIKDEKLYFMLDCIKMYDFAYKNHHGEDFWSFVPKSMIIEREDIRRDNDPISKFLKFGGQTHEVQMIQNEFTALTSLQDAFNTFLDEQNIDRGLKITKQSPQLRIYEYIQLSGCCKECKKPRSIENCGNHYRSGGARTSISGFKHMKIVSFEAQTEATIQAAYAFHENEKNKLA